MSDIGERDKQLKQLEEQAKSAYFAWRELHQGPHNVKEDVIEDAEDAENVDNGETESLIPIENNPEEHRLYTYIEACRKAGINCSADERHALHHFAQNPDALFKSVKNDVQEDEDGQKQRSQLFEYHTRYLAAKIKKRQHTPLQQDDWEIFDTFSPALRDAFYRSLNPTQWETLYNADHINQNFYLLWEEIFPYYFKTVKHSKWETERPKRNSDHDHDHDLLYYEIKEQEAIKQQRVAPSKRFQWFSWSLVLTFGLAFALGAGATTAGYLFATLGGSVFLVMTGIFVFFTAALANLALARTAITSKWKSFLIQCEHLNHILLQYKPYQRHLIKFFAFTFVSLTALSVGLIYATLASSGWLNLLTQTVIPVHLLGGAFLPIASALGVATIGFACFLMVPSLLKVLNKHLIKQTTPLRKRVRTYCMQTWLELRKNFREKPIKTFMRLLLYPIVIFGIVSVCWDFVLAPLIIFPALSAIPLAVKFTIFALGLIGHLPFAIDGTNEAIKNFRKPFADYFYYFVTSRHGLTKGFGLVAALVLLPVYSSGVFLTGLFTGYAHPTKRFNQWLRVHWGDFKLIASTSPRQAVAAVLLSPFILVGYTLAGVISFFFNGPSPRRLSDIFKPGGHWGPITLFTEKWPNMLNNVKQFKNTYSGFGLLWRATFLTFAAPLYLASKLVLSSLKLVINVCAVFAIRNEDSNAFGHGFPAGAAWASTGNWVMAPWSFFGFATVSTATMSGNVDLYGLKTANPPESVEVNDGGYHGGFFQAANKSGLLLPQFNNKQQNSKAPPERSGDTEVHSNRQTRRA